MSSEFIINNLLVEWAVQETNTQDDTIHDLEADTLREMLAIPKTTVVIKDISHQSLQVASLIDEYTKLSRTSDLLPPVKF